MSNTKVQITNSLAKDFFDYALVSYYRIDHEQEKQYQLNKLQHQQNEQLKQEAIKQTQKESKQQLEQQQQQKINSQFQEQQKGLQLKKDAQLQESLKEEISYIRWFHEFHSEQMQPKKIKTSQ